jgi:hypothetical protein
MYKHLPTAGIMVLVLSLCLAYFSPSSWLIWLNELVRFDYWAWRSVASTAANGSEVLQFRMQLAVASILLLSTTAAAVLVTSETLRTGFKSERIHLRVVVISLAVLGCIYLLVFVLPNSYIGGGITGLGLTNFLFGIPVLLSIGVMTFFAFCIVLNTFFALFNILVVTLRGYHG